jgi:hypothetical protein
MGNGLKNVIPLKEPCKTHKRETSYMAWVKYAEDKKAKGETQKQCPICGRWYFKDEL